MRPLQDQCYPTSIPKLNAMLRRDMDMGLVSSEAGVLVLFIARNTGFRAES